MFAIAEITGKQHKIQKGDVLKVERLRYTKEGDSVTIDKILLKSDGNKTDIGTPYLSGSSVELTVKAHGRHAKIRVYKKKSKKRYERTQGHRQHYTEVEITSLK